MNSLLYSDIGALIANAPPAPKLSPTKESVGPYECCVCLNFKLDTTLFHQDCLHAVCAEDAIILLDQGLHCPYCRGSLRSPGDVTTRFVKPTPSDHYWMQRIKYQCEFCFQEMDKSAAVGHLANCSMEPRDHKPPPGINPWTNRATWRQEVVSNPPAAAPQPQSSQRRDRLTIHHVNGRQLVSRFMRPNWTVYQMKTKLADLTNNLISDIRMFRFVHLELDDDAKVGDVAPSFGANYFASFTREYSAAMSNSALLLNLDEIGPPTGPLPAALPPEQLPPAPTPRNRPTRSHRPNRPERAEPTGWANQSEPQVLTWRNLPPPPDQQQDQDEEEEWW